MFRAAVHTLGAVSSHLLGSKPDPQSKSDISNLAITRISPKISAPFIASTQKSPLTIHKLPEKIDENTGFGEVFTPGMEHLIFGIPSIIKLARTFISGLASGSKEIMRDTGLKLITASASFITAILEAIVIFRHTAQVAVAVDALGVGTSVLELALRCWQLFRQFQFDRGLKFKEGNSQKIVEQNINRLFKQFFLADATEEDRAYIRSFGKSHDDVYRGLKANAEFKMKRFYRRIHCPKLAEETIKLFNSATYEDGKIVLNKTNFKKAQKIIKTIQEKSYQIKIIHIIAITALALLTIAFSIGSGGALPASAVFILMIIGASMLFVGDRLESAMLHNYDKPFDPKFLVYKRIREYIWPETKQKEKESKLNLHIYTSHTRYEKALKAKVKKKAIAPSKQSQLTEKVFQEASRKATSILHHPSQRRSNRHLAKVPS